LLFWWQNSLQKIKFLKVISIKHSLDPISNGLSFFQGEFVFVSSSLKCLKYIQFVLYIFQFHSWFVANKALLILQSFQCGFADVSKFTILHVHVNSWILLKTVLRSLQLPLPSMNWLNQTEPATFSILSCWTFFREFRFFLYLCY
jgi:hypothetical protein